MLSNLTSSFFQHAAAHPAKLALRIDGHEHSYVELALRASRIAEWIDDEYPSDARIAIHQSRTFDTYAALLGILASGRAYVPISPEAPERRVRSLLERVRAHAVIGERPATASLTSGLPARFTHGAELSERKTPDALYAPVASDAGALAYVMFTSGTTGEPKGVKVSVGNVQAFCHAAAARYAMTPSDRVSQFYELTFDPSVFDILLSLGAGASLHVVPAAQRLLPAKFIVAERLSVWSSVPSVIAFMDRTKLLLPNAFPDLRYAMLCGEPLHAPVARALARAAPACVIENQYGPTEATVTCAAQHAAQPSVPGFTPPITRGRDTVAIGPAMLGSCLAIVVEGRALRGKDAGQIGELAIAGPQVALGYLDDEAQGARKFVMLEHPEHGRMRAYLTGDLGYVDEKGCFHCLGRTDHQVKVLGQRIELEEIDAHLLAVTGSPGVTIGWPLEQGSATGLVAFVTGELSPERVQLALRERLPAYMVPKRIVALERLPVGPNGKLDRKALALLLS